MQEATTEFVLDNPAWYSLSGPHEALAEISGLARRYPIEVSPFCAISDFSNTQCWSDLAELVGPGGIAVLTGDGLTIPDDWLYVDGGHGIQMTGENVFGVEDESIISLGESDVPEMLDLVARAQPGPFLPRTIELGGYLGIRDKGALVAMAGCRLNPGGWREISAVCTDERYRGRGLASAVVLAVVAQIQTQGQLPFLHVSETNENAARLYETLGFRRRIRTTFAVISAPQT